MLPDVQKLAAEIEASNPTDPAQQHALLGRLETLRGELNRAQAEDLAVYLDSAIEMIQYVIQMGRMGPEQVLGIAAGLLRKVETSFEEGEQARRAPGVDHPSGAIPLPALASQPYGPVESYEPVERIAPEPSPELHLNSVAEERMLGEVMLQLGFVTRKQLELGLVTQRATDMRIGEALVSIGAATWENVREAIAVQGRLRTTFPQLGLKRS